MIHPTAVVHVQASIEDDVRIGPYCILEEGVVVGRQCVLDGHVVLKRGTVVESGVRIASFAVVGGEPQELTFDRNTTSSVRICNDAVLREGVTVHRSIREGGATEVKSCCYLMANAHVGHDCIVGEHVILANNVMLGGFVQLGSYSFVGGGAGLHQFIRVGEMVMVAGNAAISRDVPPYLMVAERNLACGLNLVGLRRRKVGTAAISDLKTCYRAVLVARGLPAVNARAALADNIWNTPLGRQFIEFFSDTKRGYVHTRSRS